jgi:hypothetical protein
LGDGERLLNTSAPRSKDEGPLVVPPWFSRRICLRRLRSVAVTGEPRASLLTGRHPHADPTGAFDGPAPECRSGWAEATLSPGSPLSALRIRSLTCLYRRKWRGLYRKLARLSTSSRYGTILMVMVFLTSLLFLATTIKVYSVVWVGWTSVWSWPLTG